MPKGTPRDKQAPVVNITYPLNNSTLTPSQTITITATATDNRAVGRVEFRINGTLINSDTVSLYSATWTIPSALVGYTIEAKAIDTSGNFATHTVYVNISDGVSSTSTTTTTTIPQIPLPSSFTLNTPPVIYQGPEGSCGSMAMYVALSTAKYYKLGSTSYNNSVNVYSPEYLYNQAKAASGCGSGSSIIVNLGIARDQGVCFWNTLPYDYNNGCDPAIITQPMRDEAATQKTLPYFQVLATDITAIKQALYVKKTALTTSCGLDDAAYNSTCGFIWSNTNNTLFNGNGIFYGHYMAVVGWDDSKQAWLIQNSYSNLWGCNGFMWVDYAFFTRLCYSIYGVAY